jgi:Macrocin-O-methyltransferase (TylF)
VLIVPSFQLRTVIQSAMSHVLEVVDHGTMHPTRMLRREAAIQSGHFVTQHMPGALSFYTSRQVLAHALSQVTLEGSFLEFGVFKGGTIRYIAKLRPDRTVHGFDSFEGLPVAWEGTGHDRGAFHAKGQAPRVRANVRLHRGLFDVSLPLWVRQNNDSIAFLHVDCDLYSSTHTIFEVLEDRLRPGLVIAFDEYFGYPGWQHGEHKAFLEFIEKTGHRFRYLCHAYHQVAVQIIG